jgi:hypothetical protein
MEMEMKCPHCCVVLVEDDCFDMDLISDSVIRREVVGHCPECNREYQWTEIFEYQGSVDLFLIS